MADYMSGLIEIGGKIKRSFVPKLLKELEGLRWNYIDGPVQAKTAKQLLEECQANGHDRIVVGDDQARYGCFPELEEFLIEHQIAFDRHSDAKYEHEALNRFFRPGMTEPEDRLATNSGNTVVSADTLEDVLDLMDQERWSDAKQLLQQLVQPCDALPPLTIVED